MADKDNKAKRDVAYWLAFAGIAGMGAALFRHLRRLQLERCFPLSRKDLDTISAAADFRKPPSLGAFDLERSKRLQEHCLKADIQILHWDSPAYPRALAESPFAIPVLTWKGKQWLSPDLTAVAMVGTRTPGPWAPAICSMLGQALHRHPVAIVSGLAQGIDSLCHQAALEHSLPTLAVLAQGLDLPIGGSRGRLAERIREEGGILLSPFLPGTPAQKARFIQRNQSIAALAQATLLVESRLDGGAMHTARFARQIPRPVLAIPGDIWRESAQGGNALLQKGEAQPLWKPADLPAALQLSPCRSDATPVSPWPAGWEKFRGTILTLPELQQRTGYPMHTLLAILTHLELRADCRIQDGQWIHFS